MFDAAPDSSATTPLHQSEGLARALTSLGQQPLRLCDGSYVMQRRRGPVTAHMLARAAMPAPDRVLAALKQAGVRGPVILSPDTPVDLRHLPVIPLVSPAHLAVLDLTPSVDLLRQNLHQKWRNRLKHAQKQRLRVTRQNMPDDPNHWLFAADLVQQADRGYRTWPVPLTCAFARENPGDAKLFCAHIGREPVAAVLVLRHGNTATYHIGHSRASGRMMSAHTLLLWEAICWLKRKAATRFELGLVDTEEGAGLARFKLGTGASVRPLGGTWLWWPPVTRPLRRLARLDRRLMTPD